MKKKISIVTPTLNERENIEYFISQVREEMKKLEFEYEHMMEFDSSYSDGQFKKTADNSKLMKLNPDFQFTKIGEGMNKSVKWFIDHFDECRK